MTTNIEWCKNPDGKTWDEMPGQAKEETDGQE